MHVHLETERLILRRFTPEDVDLLMELDSDPEVMRYLSGGRATPREEVEERILPLYFSYYRRFPALGYWAALERAGGGFLGWFEFRPPDPDRPDEVELGYRLRRPAWGRGYATEGARALIRKGFGEPGVERVFAQTMTVNRGSRRVMEKAGLRYVRTFFADWPEAIDGSEHGEVEYALERAEWHRLQPGPR
ncbi:MULTISPECIES: GNAT family N-acetyltransferase [Kitasatospora]|uniref:GNAT family N-acetyltransferase n=1 Tax=Kitasatospora cystarginea TaxID=58350 RepID=A0ABP5RCW5_9ACTN